MNAMDEVHISSSVLYKFLLSPVFLLSRPWGRYVHIQILLGLGECDPKFKVQIRCYHLLGIKQTFVYTPFVDIRWLLYSVSQRYWRVLNLILARYMLVTLVLIHA
jgi:hypothetical protein